MALVLTGRGKAWSGGELLSGAEALKKVGLSPLELSSKEGLALVSGTTSPTAMATIALYDFLKAARTADVIGAMSVEALEGVMNAFDERVMSVRPHLDQGKTAENVRNFLADSAVIKKGGRKPGSGCPFGALYSPASWRRQKDIERRARKHRNGDQFLPRQSNYLAREEGR